MSSLAILYMILLGTYSRSSLNYSATCLACLQEVGGIEKSVFGITYSQVEKQRRSSRGGFISYGGGASIAPIDPSVYPEISGHPCEHTFVRGGFCRYKSGTIGCGKFGARQFEFRKELMVNLYQGYRRVPDQALANETLAMIDQLYPISLTKDMASPDRRPPIEYAFQVESLPNEPLGILYRGLALISDSDEWRQVLDAARNGDGKLKFLVDPAVLESRLTNPNPAIRRQVIDQLSALNDPIAWVIIADCLKDAQIRDHAAQKIVFSGHLEFFEAVFEAVEAAHTREIAESGNPIGYTPQIFDQLLMNYSAGQIRELLSRNRPYLDRIAFAAIRRQSRIEFVDEILSILNKRPSPAAEATLESLFQGPTPFEAGMRFSDLPRLDPWEDLVAHTSMESVGTMSSYTEFGKKSILTRQHIVKLGLQRNPAKWGELLDLYIASIPQLGAEKISAAIAQAMADSDRERTLAFLLSQLDLDHSNMQQTVAAIAGLGAIADQNSLQPLSVFSGKSLRGGIPIRKHSSYKPYIDYALHRCRGIHQWRLVKISGSNYSIEK